MKKTIDLRSAKSATPRVPQKKPLRSLWDWILYSRPHDRRKNGSVVRKVKKISPHVVAFLTFAHLILYGNYVLGHVNGWMKSASDSKPGVVEKE